MRLFTPRPGTRSATLRLKKPFRDIAEFDAVVRSFVMENPLGCTSYYRAKRNHPPVEVVREMYTARFVYLDERKKRIGAGLDRYDSVEGYHTGIAAVISNMANIASHRGKAKHLPDADLFSVLLKCHTENGEFFFISLARDRITIASYTDDAIRRKIGQWADTVPALQ